MLTYVTDSIFSSPASVLVNTVNTVGVMGKGLAFEFKKLFPDMFEKYQKECEDGNFGIGDLLLYRTPNKGILNFPTKKHWRSPARIEYIEAGLQAFVSAYREQGIYSIAFPQLGCGNGELDWEKDVRPIMEKYLIPLPISIYIHVYSQHGPAEHRVTKEMKSWLRSEPRSLSVFEVWEDLYNTPMPRESEDMTYLDADDSASDAVALRWIWEQLRAFGFVSKDQILDEVGPKGWGVATSLASLDYVEWATFALIRSREATERVPTARLLDQGANGIRLVPEKLPTRPIEPQLLIPVWSR